MVGTDLRTTFQELPVACFSYSMTNKTAPRSGSCLPQLVPLPTLPPFHSVPITVVITITMEGLLCSRILLTHGCLI